MTYEIFQGDCRELLRDLPDACIDAIVTDPPYELGLMGKPWDSSGIAYNVAMWAECLRVLKPGGHLVAFGGTRTYHKMTCAIEDAGFAIRDSLHWIYGSGFPKSMNVEKSGAGEAWHGWGTALKPAHEPIMCARKPIVGTVAANVLKHGTGAMNIDGTRVAFQSDDDKESAFPGGKLTSHGSGSLAGPGAAQEAQRSEFVASQNESGRWPPNVLLSHTEDCEDQCAEDCPVAEMDRQSGSSVSKKGKPRDSVHPGDIWGMTKTGAEYDDAGGASRFFPCFRYHPKTSRKERDAGCEGIRARHPTVKPIELMKWLVRLVTPPNGIVLDPFTGSGSTGVACMLEGFNFVGFEQSAEYVEIAEARIGHAEMNK